jgi:alcohol dehydrogenase class IV
VDAELALGCPPQTTAWCGADALTQLVEALVSMGGTPFTDALAVSGLEALRRGLPAAVARGDDLEARALAAHAAFLSGVALAHAGLGAVHGLAAPLGARLGAPHAALCARLLPVATEANLAALRAGRGSARGLAGYARAAAALGEPVEEFARRFPAPGLARHGLAEAGIPEVLAGATGGGMRTNPVELSPGELGDILRRAM